MPWRTFSYGLIALLILFLVFVWYDGGREPMRMIETPVSMPGETR